MQPIKPMMTMPEPSPDPRTPVERAVDLTDQLLFDFYHRNSLIEAAPDTQFSREALMNLVRDAYWVGVADRARDPDGTARVARAIRHLAEAADAR